MDPLSNIASPRHATDHTESQSPIMIQKQPTPEIPDQQTVPEIGGHGGPRKILVQPFEEIQRTLADLEINDPKLAFQAARLVGLYQRLWESCFLNKCKRSNLFGRTIVWVRL
ncbi:hypothetical protein N7456_007093 [Penicillium angulare]|uniref:Uncharacterized protein n=1 Tax=Penicillium angulare TaxID=116970 RepID=A0A9W9KCT0_9EURO|nr:hypothetical protein N7456_007093 [Penicillium angulare]